MKKHIGLLAGFLCLITLSQFPGNAYGAGFGIFTQGAAELAQGNATIAHSEGPASLFFNPALMNSLDGSQAEIGTSMLMPVIDYESDLALQDGKTKNMDCYPSTIYLTHKYNDKLSTGLGLFTPFGNGTRWDETWEGRYIVTESKMTTLDINPAASFKVTPRLSLAAGLNVILLNSLKDNKLNLSLWSEPDGEQKFKGDGDGFGYNIGLLYEINDELSLGASYRSAIDVEIDGKVSFNVATSLSAFFPNTDADAEITLPAQAHMGLSYKVGKQFLIEAALRWVGWSVYDRVTTKFEKAVAGSLSNTEVNSWRDTLAFKLGGRYSLSDKTTLFAGYQYGKGASPDRTFNPATPDSDSHTISAGGTIRNNDISVKLAYAYRKFESRQINNNVGAALGGTADGSYEADMHTLAVSLTYAY